MSYHGANLAYAFEDAKSAALWFDYVAPVDPEALGTGDFNGYDVLNELLPPIARNTAGVLEQYEAALFDNDDWWLLDDLSLSLSKEHWTVQFSSDFIIYLKRSVPGFSKDYAAACDFGEEIRQDFHGVRYKVSRKKAPDDPSVTLPAVVFPHLNLIDTQYVPWNAVIEFRKDRESVAKLRRLRLFMFENYSGKPVSYVRDDILKRIDDYETTAKRWGMRTALQTMQGILSLKSLPAVAASAFAASAGAGLTTAIAIGAGLEIASVATGVYEKIDVRRNDCESNPVSYLVDVKQLGLKNDAGGPAPQALKNAPSIA